MKPIQIAIHLLVVAILASCSEEKAADVPAARYVRVVVAKDEPISQSRTITGEVEARVQTDLSFRVSGKIIERFVDVGDEVKSGQLLARIDSEEQKAELAVAVANLDAAKAQETQARLALNRQQNLFRMSVGTRAQLDQAQQAISTAQASVQSAQAQMDTARDALSYTELKADSAGVITARDAEVGQVAQAAQAIFTLAHRGPRDAVFEVVESLFLDREIDPAVTVAPLSDPTRHIDASVREVSPTIDASSGTIRVKVDLGETDPMPLGASVSGSFSYKPLDAIRLPWSAMASKGGLPAVWVLDPAANKVSIRPIHVAEYETAWFIVESGVAPGDIIVSEGTKFLRDGELVSYDKEPTK